MKHIGPDLPKNTRRRLCGASAALLNALSSACLLMCRRPRRRSTGIVVGLACSASRRSRPCR
jgi:hypothetical protein